jgi:hypothetical protein
MQSGSAALNDPHAGFATKAYLSKHQSLWTFILSHLSPQDKMQKVRVSGEKYGAVVLVLVAHVAWQIL